MRMTIVGKEVLNYPRKTGGQVRAVKLFYTCIPDSNSIEGLCAGEQYFSDKYSVYNQALPVSVGDEVDAYFNQRGYIDTLVIVPPSPAPAAAADKK